jgi:hypothetical protein
VSFALCLVYLLLFSFSGVRFAALIGMGTIIIMLLGCREYIVTTAITTAVIMVVAAMSPANAWQQPLLRLVDTVLGVGIGVAGKWAASLLHFKMVGKGPANKAFELHRLIAFSS